MLVNTGKVEAKAIYTIHKKALKRKPYSPMLMKFRQLQFTVL